MADAPSVAAANAIERRHVVIEGVVYHYQASGRGTPVVVMSHGPAGMAEIAERLGSSFRVVVIDISQSQALEAEHSTLLKRIVDQIERRELARI